MHSSKLLKGVVLFAVVGWGPLLSQTWLLVLLAVSCALIFVSTANMLPRRIHLDSLHCIYLHSLYEWLDLVLLVSGLHMLLQHHAPIFTFMPLLVCCMLHPLAGMTYLLAVPLVCFVSITKGVYVEHKEEDTGHDAVLLLPSSLAVLLAGCMEGSIQHKASYVLVCGVMAICSNIYWWTPARFVVASLFVLDRTGTLQVLSKTHTLLH